MHTWLRHSFFCSFEATCNLLIWLCFCCCAPWLLRAQCAVAADFSCAGCRGSLVSRCRSRPAPKRTATTVYSIKISSAKMPAKCWGNYVHVAVMAHEPGHTAHQIRDTSKQKIVQHWGRQHDGGARSASAKAEQAARELIAELSQKGA